MERDLAAIQAKLDSLESEARINEKEHPEEAAVIRERIETIQKDWEELTHMVNKIIFLILQLLLFFKLMPIYNNIFYTVERKRF